nr:condensation domain-containing protein [uncultured bacterium]
MTDVSKLLGELTPEQWKLLQLRLKKKQSAQGEPEKAGRIPRRDPGQQELPLSFSQQRLWFLDQWEPGNPAYNMFAAFRLEGTLDPASLARAIEEIVRRHESLRTTFTSEAGRPWQVVSAPGPVPLPLADLSGLPPGQAAAEVRGLGAAHAGRSFDLERGPLLRITLVRLAPAEHWVLLAVHHIVSDGWSMGVFNRELATLYAAFLKEAPSPLPPLAIQYPDYALWQREWLAGETLERQLAFWRELLTGAPPLLDLPLDHSRGALPGAPAGSVTMRVPKDASDRLQALAVAEGGTLYMVLLAGFVALLARYTGSGDVVVGAPVANRNRSDIEGLIGFFVNTLAVRVSAEGDPTGRELLRRARKVTSGAYDHQDVPFELLVDEIQPERDLSHPPLVQVTLGLQNLPPQSVDLPGLRLSLVPLDSPAAKFDMVWALAETPEGIKGGVEFNLNLFEPATAARMAGHFASLLQALAESPDARVSELPFLSDLERHQLIVAWNDTATAFPRERTVVELFEEWVATAPAATAVVFRDQSLTYGELDARAGRLARRLRKLGVGPEVPVGLCADRSLDLIVGLLAIVKAGGAFVPLDPAYPSERLGYMLESSGAPLVLAQAGTRSSLPEDLQAQVLLLEEIQGEDAGEDAPAVHPLPENLLYIIYTSGSTGKPKGVAVSHRSAIRLVRDVDYARLDASETFLQIVPLSFDPSMFEIWGALLNGARLVLFPTRVPTLEEIEETVRDKGVTTLWLTTGLFHQVVDHKIEALYPLRQLLAGGEALSLPHVRKVLEHLPGVRMVNGYGPTEVTCFTTTWQAEPLPADATGVPIGKPMSNTRTLVLGRHDGRLVPVGVWGELYAGGVGVARGYFGRPDLTAERFVPDPFPPEGEAGSRLYRTGDRARLLADGTIEFAGRYDNQVKVRGFRIELGEIETALAHLPGVLESTVLVREDSPGVRRITAYAVPKDGVTLDPEALRTALGETLPEYMIPTAWVVLDALPLTPNGKIDRRALPAPEAEHGASEYVAPRNDTEALLAGIWADVLGVERIGVEDDFFDLGGNSLLSLQVAARAGQAGLSFHVREMFEHSTVASLARALGAETAPVEPPIEPVPRDKPLPLSFAQQRLWFLDRLEPGSPLYNIFTGLRLTGRLDVSALQRAITEVVRRHEAVRSVFAAGDGEPVQIVMPPPESFPLELIDLSSSPIDPGDRARQLVVEEASRPFDLANGPLLRVTLVRLAPEEHLALLTMHHIASDGWSMGILVREITTLYAAFLESRPSPLPDLQIQYADFAVWQRGWLTGEVLEGEIAFWRERLAGAPPVLELPTDRPRPSTRRNQGAVETRMLPASLLADLDALSRQEGASLFMTTLAAAQTLLFRVTGQDDVVVGSPVANRNRVEIEPLIGFFVNTLVLRTVLDGDPGFREAVGRVREGALSAYAHQDVPFERLVEELRPERSLAHTPIFQVMVLLQNASRDRFSLPGLEAEGLAGEQATAKFDLLLAFAETPQGLIASLEYDTDLFFPATARRLLGQLETLLTAAVAEPDCRIGDLPLLSGPERQQLLVEWNDASISWPVEGCLHELIERQVERAPEAVAVTFEDRSLTYAELNGLANRWAWVLRDLGVGPDTLVGVCLERSIEMVVALVSVIKAGGAYVPIDPSYPKDRLVYMLGDSRVPVLLTQERLLPTLPLPEGDGLRAICLDTSEPPVREGRPDSGTTAKSAAYAIYTSGSTGKPKGAVNSHEGIVNRLLWMQSAYGLGPGDHVLQKTPFSFDVSVWEFFWPLMMGARLVVAKPGGHQDPSYLARLIQEEGITTLHFVPSMLQVFLEEPAVSGCTSLRRVMASGEALPVELEERFFERMPAGVELHNLYGPTEAAVDVTYEPCIPNRGASSVPIGRPVANTRIHLLDRSMRLVPMGVAGELHIGGIQLARGYLRRPELTAERFVPDPCSPESGSRLYKTATSRAICRTAAWSTWAGWTSRSRSAASASSWARSRRRSTAIRRCARASSSRETTVAASASSPTWYRRKARSCPSPPCASRWARACRSIWCPRPSWCWKLCRSRPTARWSARPFPLPMSQDQESGSPRALPPRSCWPRSGLRSWAAIALAPWTTSSSWAATRCSPPRWSPACARCSAWSCLCAPCSPGPRWPPWRGRSRRAPRERPRCRPSCPFRGKAAVRSPSPSSASGSWTAWSPATPSITCRSPSG